MANSIYAIPIKKLYDEKNDPTMDSFTSGLDIDLNTEISCEYPTVLNLKKAINDAGLEISIEQFKNFHDQDGWCCGVKEPEGYDTPISADKVKSESELITDILSFPKGKWETVVRLLIELEKIIGPILFYCDSGDMTIIKRGKTTEQILSEMN